MTTTQPKNLSIIYIALISSIAFVSSPLLWSKSSSLSSHTHGKAELMVAIENNQIEIQLISPAANILGFEHAPSTPKQKEQIQHATEILSTENRLFEFEGATCQAVDQTLDIPFSEKVSEVDHAEDNHEHGDKHHHEEHQNEHVEVVANYRFECDRRAPTALRVLILDHFTAIELLAVQWISEEKQGAAELNINQTKIDLR